MEEFYSVVFREKIYRNLESLQKDLDERLHYCNYERTPQGNMRCQAATRLEGILHAALAFIHSFSITEGGKSNWRRALDMVVFPWVISSDLTLTTSCIARSANASPSAMNSDHTRLSGASRGLSLNPNAPEQRVATFRRNLPSS